MASRSGFSLYFNRRIFLRKVELSAGVIRGLSKQHISAQHVRPTLKTNKPSELAVSASALAKEEGARGSSHESHRPLSLAQG